MADTTELSTRAATLADAAAIAAIYNEGIADRIATLARQGRWRHACDILQTSWPEIPVKAKE
jgi:hypothetical protein